MDTGYIVIIILFCTVVFARWKTNQNDNADKKRNENATKTKAKEKN